jgi:hypothetical protein
MENTTLLKEFLSRWKEWRCAMLKMEENNLQKSITMRKVINKLIKIKKIGFVCSLCVGKEKSTYGRFVSA